MYEKYLLFPFDMRMQKAKGANLRGGHSMRGSRAIAVLPIPSFDIAQIASSGSTVLLLGLCVN